MKTQTPALIASRAQHRHASFSATSVDAAVAFTPRPTDVFVLTPPKTGTTWMQMVLHCLRMATATVTNDSGAAAGKSGQRATAKGGDGDGAAAATASKRKRVKLAPPHRDGEPGSSTAKSTSFSPAFLSSIPSHTRCVTCTASCPWLIECLLRLQSDVVNQF